MLNPVESVTVKALDLDRVEVRWEGVRMKTSSESFRWERDPTVDGSYRIEVGPLRLIALNLLVEAS